MDNLTINRPKQCRQFARSGSCSYGPSCKFFHETTWDNLNSMFRKVLSLDESHERLVQLFKSVGDPRTHIRAFFNKYPTFDYKPTKPVMGQFYAMCDYFKWDGKKDRNGQYIDPRRKAASEGFKDSLTLQFNAIYGTDENSLVAWQNLCIVLNLGDVPEELNACRNLVRSMYVNIIDLLEVPITLEFVHHFKSEEMLSRYTKGTGKYFPLNNAYAGGLLKFLLRRIMNPRRDPEDEVYDSDDDHPSS
ncbi:hypothetical protein RSAG8_11716, partial [Rhizoctonia solani AG-8 WAC10335]